MNASLISLLVCAALPWSSVIAAPLAVESADYSAPRNSLTGLPGGTGWAGPWDGSGLISAGGLSRGLLLSAGNRFTLSFSGGSASRPLETAAPLGADGTTLWVSFLLRSEFAIPGGGPGGLSTLTTGDFDGDGAGDDVAGAIYGTPAGTLFLLTQ